MKTSKRDEITFLINLAKIQIVVSVMIAVYLLFLTFDKTNEAILTLAGMLVLTAYYALKIKAYTSQFD